MNPALCFFPYFKYFPDCDSLCLIAPYFLVRRCILRLYISLVFPYDLLILCMDKHQNSFFCRNPEQLHKLFLVVEKHVACAASEINFDTRDASMLFSAIFLYFTDIFRGCTKMYSKIAETLARCNPYFFPQPPHCSCLRIGIGHVENCCNAACKRSPASTAPVFLVRKPRLPEMHMHINDARHHNLPET